MLTMRSVLSILAFTACASAAAVSNEASSNSAELLNKRDDTTFSCKGQPLCSTLEVKYCDGTVNNKIERNTELSYSTVYVSRAPLLFLATTK